MNTETNAAKDDAATSKGLLLVVNKGDDTLSIIDSVEGIEVATVPEEASTGHEVAASPDGKMAFVPIFGKGGVGSRDSDGSLIRVIDLTTCAVSGTIDFARGVRPHDAVFHPHNGLLFVTTELENSVSVVDPHQLAVVDSIPTGQPQSHMLAITRDGKRAYTANIGPGTVSALDLEKGELITVIPVAKTVQRISLSVDDRRVFTADQTNPQLAVIDTETNRVESWIPLPSNGYGTAPTPDGRWLLVALNRASQVGVVDLETMRVVRTIDVPRAPQEVLVRPDGAVAYVSCDASQQVAVIDVKDWTVSKLIDTGPGTDGLAWAGGR